MIKVILLLLTISPYLLAQEYPDYVIELCRHGAKGPSETTIDPNWPKWAYENLTPQGMRMQFLLGRAIAAQYPNIFDQVTPNVLNIMSDGGNRTTMSALSQVYGYYLGKGPGLGEDFPENVAAPPFNSEVINQTEADLSDSAALPGNYYPIDVTYAEGSDSTVINPTLACAGFKDWMGMAIFSAESFETWGNFTEFIDTLKIYDIGFPMNNPLVMMMLADTVASNFAYGRELPGNLPNSSDFLFNLTALSAWYMIYFNFGNDMKIWSTATPMVNRLVTVLEQMAAGKISQNFWLYSGHDMDLLTLLTAFGVVNPECILQNFQTYWWGNRDDYNPACIYPVFASAITIELYNATSNPTVRFLFNNYPQALCNDSEYCSLPEFVQFAQNSVNHWTNEQAQTVCNGGPEPSHPGYLALMQEKVSKFSIQDVAVFALTILCLGLGMQVLSLKRKEQRLKHIIQNDERTFSLISK